MAAGDAVGHDLGDSAPVATSAKSATIRPVTDQSFGRVLAVTVSSWEIRR
jgi:hypothetical protein